MKNQDARFYQMALAVAKRDRAGFDELARKSLPPSADLDMAWGTGVSFLCA